ncbi:helix-turn-helix transcriptional regulator [Nocardia sp. NPDC050718]|uniref:helix-turn-helix transcriptional regulator n=1 Tax=Nocardia sp. NPDC050718 TaxID=3155788 RepID=UPI0033FDBB37
MEFAEDIKEFLTTRRAKIVPGQVGLPTSGRRRVAGLRREEVALLAGVSAEYYIRIERGRVDGVSDDVLHAIASALRLDEAETEHLFDLARAATIRPGRRRGQAPKREQVPEGILALMDSMTAPAVVQNGCLDLLGANTLGRVLYGPVYERQTGTPNLARFLFLDPRAGEVFPEWERAIDEVVALLRVETTRAPQSTALTGLIGELATRSAEFRTRWAAHDVRVHRRGSKTFRHPVVGTLPLRYEALEIGGTAGLTLMGFTAVPGSTADEALRLLSSWAATEQTAATTPVSPAIDE